MAKLSFDHIFMNLATDLSKRSHCVKAHVGAVLAKDTRIISIGYNGPLQALTIATKNGPKQAVHAIQKAVAPLLFMPKKTPSYML